MLKGSKKFFWLSFGLTFAAGSVFLLLFSPQVQNVQAADIDVSVAVTAVCGNGVKETGEACDGSDGIASCSDFPGNTSCNSNCTCPVCGNGAVDSGESCESASDCAAGQYCSPSCVCGVQGCFLGGTKISLANNKSLPVEEIKAGDAVLSYNELNGRLEPAEVLRTFIHQAGYYLFINDKLRVTNNHPFYVNGRQWLAAGELKIGDELLNEQGQAVAIFSIKTKIVNSTVYNLEVDRNHNYFAEGYLAHNKGGCTPGAVVCDSWGGCVEGQQTRICGNGCSFWTESRSCCGNGNLDAGEECDDGNIVSGDGCSGTCQVEVGCGDGNLDPGEECDDGDRDSGDCCSASCKIELLINANESGITNTSAAINWQTSCQTTNSLLEWGRTMAVNEGSVSMSGTNYSRTISGLLPATLYYYKITASASAGGLQAVQTGSFQTLGGFEICDNGIDDTDNDGFCDYPASTCVDGSIPGDSECVCTPDWLCAPGPCGADNKWTVDCVDQRVPKCRLDYSYVETCGVCPGIFCEPCQELDEEECVCFDLANCCGNGVCEPPSENFDICPEDCAVECLSKWACTDWQPPEPEPCPKSGFRIRECYDEKACKPPSEPSPSTQLGCAECKESCIGPCQQINIEQCICEELIPCCGNGRCENGETYEQCPDDCIEVCIPNWVPGEWSECMAGRQTRNYEDLNNCPYALSPPPGEISCTPGCDAACGLCQQLNLEICSCSLISPCCGDRVCEVDQGENVITCPVDCGFPPGLRLTLPQCLDGLDNDNDGEVDYPADTGCAKPSDNSELSLADLLKNLLAFTRDKIWGNPQVQQVNKIIAPFLIAAIIINTFSAFSLVNFLAYMRYFFSQPLAAVFRRRRRKWGVVYNSLTKQPIDLAIVRLYRKEDGRLIQSRVTDKLGRYIFLVSPGRYYLTITKPKFNFPTKYLQDKKEDVKYLDLYHGETVEATDENANITLNVPLDPIEEVKPPKKVVIEHYLRRIQYFAAFTGIPLATASLVISPSAYTAVLLCFHCLLYVLFRRLGYQKPPKSWGIVYDQGNKKPIGRAIARIYDKQYNKLLESRMTDLKGRYSFLVNNNVYYLTSEKSGYQPFKSQEIDLVKKDREAVVGMDIGLKKSKAESAPKEASFSASLRPPEIPIKDASGIDVNRAPLEDLMKKKEELRRTEGEGIGRIQKGGEDVEIAEDFKQDIDQKLEEIDVETEQGEEKKPEEEKSIFG